MRPTPRAARLTLGAALASSLCLGGLAVGSSTPPASHGRLLHVAGLPAGVPPAARQPEPRIPRAAGWPFPDAFPRTSGTGRLDDGALYWTDFVYDDHGAFGIPVSPPVATLAPAIGTYVYPAGPAHGNGADIFRASVGLDSDASYWRVDWTTLTDPRVPVAEWALDTDARVSTGTATWPAGAGLTSPGIDRALVVTSRGARLLDGQGRVVATLRTTVDRGAQSFVVRVPRTLLPVSGTSRIRLAAGLANAAGTEFAPVGPQDGARPGEPPVYNVGFRTRAQEPASCDHCVAPDLTGVDRGAQTIDTNFWNEADQAKALQTGDVSSFSDVVDWSALQEHRSTPEPRPTGVSTRWYVTTLHLGQGVVHDAGTVSSGDLRPNFLARVQPYTVFVPRSYRPGRATPLTWVLHSLTVNHNQYAALDPHFLEHLCDARHSICATTLGFGPDGWYFDEAEVDFWQVWHQLADTYTLDPRRTVISGYSMGGFASYKLGLTYPDLFAEAMPLAGPPTCGVRVYGPIRGQGSGKGPCDPDGDTTPLVANARWLPYDIADGAIDELVPFTSVVEQVDAFHAAGLRYTFFAFPAEGHNVFAVQDDFDGPVAALHGTPTLERNPPTIHYAWYPDGSDAALGLGPTGVYWIRDISARASRPGQLAVIDAVDGARAGRPHRVVERRSVDPFAGPTPAVVTTSTWRPTGRAPATARTLALRLADVSRLTVDLGRARLAGPSPAHIDVRTDGRTRLVLTTTEGSAAVLLPHAGHWLVTVRQLSVFRAAGR